MVPRCTDSIVAVYQTRFPTGFRQGSISLLVEEVVKLAGLWFRIELFRGRGCVGLGLHKGVGFTFYGSGVFGPFLHCCFPADPRSLGSNCAVAESLRPVREGQRGLYASCSMDPLSFSTGVL